MLIQADLHTHTIASTHAYSTITENCQQAERIGLKCVAMTDHAMMMPDSPHIWHFGNMTVLPRKISNVCVLKGAEVNIYNYNGDIDIPEQRLKKLEWVVASYHRYMFEGDLPDDPKTVTDGYMKLFENPYVDLIGHPTTTLFPVEWERFVIGAKEHDKLLELNESSVLTGKSPKENVVAMLELCKKYDVPICVDSDAHFWSGIGQTPLAEQILSELDFPQKLIANADWNSLRERILIKRPHLDI